MQDRNVSSGEQSKPRILLVEDDSRIRDFLALVLSNDYVVETASNGKEALRIVAEVFPELVVTDVVMPELNGIELLRALRSMPATQTIPVLLVSGSTPDEWRIEGFKEGADGYLAKPYTEVELRARLGAMLQAARLRREVARREAREQAEQRALAERAELLESITDAFYALDGGFRFTYLNQRALDHFGESRESLLGRVVWDAFPVTRGTVFQHQYERAMREQCSVAFEAVSPLSQRWVEARAYPSRQGLAVYFRDVTDRKLAEEQMRVADQRKSEFLAILAHELRNPLAPLRNGLHLLKLESMANATLARTVGMMDRQMNHLVRLVDDLLDVSRITRGTLELRRRRLRLVEVLETSVEDSGSFIQARQHALVVDVRNRDVWIEGDPDRLAQVFSNLLSNSAKYTDPGGRISLKLERENDHAVVAVEDTGIGIPQSALEQVFDMFSRLPLHEERVADGLGIGLSLVRTLVQMHGGSVEAFSEGPGRGSRFTVRLPLVAGVSVADTSVRGTVSDTVRGRRVLIVDDNADAAVSLAALLEMEGCEVRTAADGAAAVEQARVFGPQVIFMDLAMPRMGGVEAARRIRALPQGRSMRIVALTGLGQEADRLSTQEAGMSEHLVKPVSLEALHRVLGAGEGS